MIPMPDEFLLQETNVNSDWNRRNFAVRIAAALILHPPPVDREIENILENIILDGNTLVWWWTSDLRFTWQPDVIRLDATDGSIDSTWHVGGYANMVNNGDDVLRILKDRQKAIQRDPISAAITEALHKANEGVAKDIHAIIKEFVILCEQRQLDPAVTLQEYVDAIANALTR